MFKSRMRFEIGRNEVHGLVSSSENYAEVLHSHTIEPNQCGSIMVQHIPASVQVVWSVVRAFDKPQVYKKFIQTCHLTKGDGGVGSIREIFLVSGIPATSSLERLEILDEERHIFSWRVLQGGHRLQNYRSVTTLHEQVVDGRQVTTVLESYVVDVPDGNTREETHMFADTVVMCNLKSLSQVAEQRTIQAITNQLSASSMRGWWWEFNCLFWVRYGARFFWELWMRRHHLFEGKIEVLTLEPALEGDGRVDPAWMWANLELAAVVVVKRICGECTRTERREEGKQWFCRVLELPPFFYVEL